MKKLNVFALVALFCLVIASCGKSKSEGSSDSYDGPLIGYWVSDEDEEETMQFTKSGTAISVGEYTQSIDGRVIESYRYFTECSYKVDGNKLTLIDGNPITVEFEIQDDVMKLKREDGKTVVAHRITEEKYKELTEGVLSEKPKD